VPERHRLSEGIASAVLASYKAKANVDTAKKNRSADLVPLQSELTKARRVERDATHALDDHIQSHGCRGVTAATDTS